MLLHLIYFSAISMFFCTFPSIRFRGTSSFCFCGTWSVHPFHRHFLYLMLFRPGYEIQRPTVSQPTVDNGGERDPPLRPSKHPSCTLPSPKKWNFGPSSPKNQFGPSPWDPVPPPYGRCHSGGDPVIADVDFSRALFGMKYGAFSLSKHTEILVTIVPVSVNDPVT